MDPQLPSLDWHVYDWLMLHGYEAAARALQDDANLRFGDGACVLRVSPHGLWCFFSDAFFSIAKSKAAQPLLSLILPEGRTNAGRADGVMLNLDPTEAHVSMGNVVVQDRHRGGQGVGIVSHDSYEEWHDLLPAITISSISDTMLPNGELPEYSLMTTREPRLADGAANEPPSLEALKIRSLNEATGDSPVLFVGVFGRPLETLRVVSASTLTTWQCTTRTTYKALARVALPQHHGTLLQVRQNKRTGELAMVWRDTCSMRHGDLGHELAAVQIAKHEFCCVEAMPNGDSTLMSMVHVKGGDGKIVTYHISRDTATYTLTTLYESRGGHFLRLEAHQRTGENTSCTLVALVHSDGRISVAQWMHNSAGESFTLLRVLRMPFAMMTGTPAPSWYDVGLKLVIGRAGMVAMWDFSGPNAFDPTTVSAHGEGPGRKGKKKEAQLTCRRCEDVRSRRWRGHCLGAAMREVRVHCQLQRQPARHGTRGLWQRGVSGAAARNLRSVGARRSALRDAGTGRTRSP